ncbi:hypothetical protein [Sphingomonas paeninsulae]|nr:hypothetical protein [Sphingomonas paeninsulae]
MEDIIIPDDNSAFISIAELYSQLCVDSDILARLEAAGVDNWEGYPCIDEEDDEDDAED